jgi:excisionase family DNA binding protein
MNDDQSDPILIPEEMSQRLRCSNAQADRRRRSPRLKLRVTSQARPRRSESTTTNDGNHGSWTNLPMTVKEAARFLGVSPQTVYLWVERKQIPHFRVMGRNIRFLKSDLKPFRAQFKHEVENGKTA